MPRAQELPADLADRRHETDSAEGGRAKEIAPVAPGEEYYEQSPQLEG
jgi:hypothetical protein